MTTSTHDWHADEGLLATYLAGGLDPVVAASLEQHVTLCPTCRARVGGLLEPQLVERTWEGIVDAVEQPQLPAFLVLAGKLGLPESTSVLLAGAASLRGAWLLGAFLSLSFATCAAYLASGFALAPFLILAPLAPVLGVAAAYGPRHDPTEAVIATAPYGRTRLILVRTAAVLVSVLPVTVLLGLALPGPAWLAAAWLGPALALVPVLLALGVFVGPRIAGGLVALGWASVVLASTRLSEPLWPVDATRQGIYLVLGMAACLVIAINAGAGRQRGVVL